MTEALLGWQTQGPIETLLLLLATASVLLGLLLSRLPRVDTAFAAIGGSGLLALGAFASHQRLAAVPWLLEGTPARRLLGRIALSEAQSVSVMGGALTLAACVGAGWAWRRSAPSDRAVPVLPTAITTLAVVVTLLGSALPPSLPSPGDLFPVLATVGVALLLGSVLRPSLAWQGPALAMLLGSVAVTHGALMRALVLDADVRPVLYPLLWLRDVAAALGLLGVLATLPTLRRPHALVPVLLIAASTLPILSQFPAQWARRPIPVPATAPLDPSPSQRPEGLAGGCLVTDGEGVPIGLRSEVHRLVGCDEGSVTTVRTRGDDALAQLAAAAGDARDVGILAPMDPDVPRRLAPWLTARWTVPVWRLDPDAPPPVRGSLMVRAGSSTASGPDGPTDLSTALTSAGTVEILVHTDEATVRDFIRLCNEALDQRPRGLRCGLAVGDVDEWTRRLSSP